MKLQLYELTKCGFYESLSDTDPVQFGWLSDWWDEFSGWASGKDYKQTGTFTDSLEPNTVFCIGRAEDNSGNYGVALWNVSTSWDGRALHLPPYGVVDNIQAAVADVEEGATAGWPTYFWLMPGESVVAALIPEGFRGSGIPYARRYFHEYLKTRSGYVRRGGFNQPGFDEPLSLVPRFETTALRRPGPLEEITSQWRDIRKYVTKTSFEPPPTDQRSRYHSIIAALLPDSVENEHTESKMRKTRTFQIEADWNPDSEDAVKAAIRSWDDRYYDDNNWAGVKIKGRLYRFDNMVCREPIALSANLDTDPRWDRESLIRIWDEARSTALSLINQARRDSATQD